MTGITAGDHSGRNGSPIVLPCRHETTRIGELNDQTELVL